MENRENDLSLFGRFISEEIKKDEVQDTKDGVKDIKTQKGLKDSDKPVAEDPEEIKDPGEKNEDKSYDSIAHSGDKPIMGHDSLSYNELHKIITEDVSEEYSLPDNANDEVRSAAKDLAASITPEDESTKEEYVKQFLDALKEKGLDVSTVTKEEINDVMWAEFKMFYEDFDESRTKESKLREDEMDLPQDQSGKMVGWIGMYKGNKVEILKSEADGLYGAKVLAAQKLKVPKSGMGLLSITPAYESKIKEVILLKKEMSGMKDGKPVKYPAGARIVKYRTVKNTDDGSQSIEIQFNKGGNTIIPADEKDEWIDESKIKEQGVKQLKDIYGAMKKINVPMDNHESDLYVKVTPESTEIIGEYEHKGNVTKFKSETDGDMWYDIPFAYTPWWDSKLNNATGGRRTKIDQDESKIKEDIGSRKEGLFAIGFLSVDWKESFPSSMIAKLAKKIGGEALVTDVPWDINDSKVIAVSSGPVTSDELQRMVDAGADTLLEEDWYGEGPEDIIRQVAAKADEYGYEDEQVANIKKRKDAYRVKDADESKVDLFQFEGKIVGFDKKTMEIIKNEDGTIKVFNEHKTLDLKYTPEGKVRIQKVQVK